MTENILTDAEKLKKVVDMASQQNSKHYEVSNPQEFKKAVEESKSSTIKYDERVAPEIPTLMSKEQWDGLVETNNKSIKKQVKKKKDDSLEVMRKEISELKEVMKMQMEVDKMRKSQQVSNIVSKKPENMDGEGYIDMTKQTSPMNVTQKEDMIMSPKVQTPKVAGERNPLPVILENNIQKPITDKDKKISSGKPIRWIIYSVLCLGISFGIVKFVGNANYLISIVSSIVLTFAFSLTYYLLNVKISEHQIPRKETINYNDFELAEIKNCPNCNSKIRKSKVIPSIDGYRQFYKCSNIECNFQKTIDIKKEHGY